MFVALFFILQRDLSNLFKMVLCNKVCCTFLQLHECNFLCSFKCNLELSSRTFPSDCTTVQISMWQKLKALELRSQLRVKERVVRVLILKNIRGNCQY
ncbi:hypothetical protein BpHYR1_011118 [Brachionus plicatilis]|uniref:Uncharacterized protein n=1 Tax=Brachionus plicatilis TaxID=10195 RepID=A0A3M7RA45_BRAPC|nr:hypothetical protein BpHYR1_011118 [Brachionus plicatilis]